MKRKYWLVALTAALILCLLASSILVYRINDARSHLALTRPGAFNYLLQSNRNLDNLIDALRSYRDQKIDGKDTSVALRKSYRQSFDIVWGGFTVFDINFSFQPEQQRYVTELLDFAAEYLTANESLMTPDHVLSVAEVDQLITGARSITELIDEVGHQYFIFATRLTDLWNQKLRRLHQFFLACVALSIVVGASLFGLLVLSLRRSDDLIKKSDKNQREMKRLIDELRSGKLENKAKDNFIAAASHDLRQPLHALGLFLGATEKHIKNDVGREALAEARNCITELNRLFNSLLDLSRLDAGVIEANKTSFKLDRLLSLMSQEFSASAAQRGIRFEVCTDAHYVDTDAILLNRILRNIVDNAFTHSGATMVKIDSRPINDVVRVTVSDDGAGIPISEQSDIFSEYYQLDNPERDRSKGLGLGLSIVKRLCEILGINVTLESDGEGGTMFHLDVPAGNSHSLFLRELAIAPERKGRVPAGALVAVIDDDINVRRGMIAILQSMGFETVVAESAMQMIQVLEQEGRMPDVLIADYRLLENQTGDVAIREVRSACGVDIPAMIITGDTSPGRMSEATASGFELMHKPVEPDELVARIGRLLRPVVEPMVQAN